MHKMRRERFPKFSHQWLDQANLEMCCAIARKIRKNPALMRIPRQNLATWKRKIHPWPAAIREWELILQKHSLDEILQILTEDSAAGQRLRQSDPFIGILSERERLSFLELDEKIAA